MEHMKGIGKMIYKMVLVNKSGLISRNIKVNIRKEWNMEKEFILGKMALFIMEIGSIINLMVMVCIKN